MPYLIVKKLNTTDRNEFYESCMKDSLVCVVCKTRTKYADVEFDAHTLGDEVRAYFLKNASELTLISESIFADFGRPKTTQRGLGYTISFRDLELDTAKKITIELARRLEILVSEISQKLEVG